jgi:hypothetical protein
MSTTLLSLLLPFLLSLAACSEGSDTSEGWPAESTAAEVSAGEVAPGLPVGDALYQVEVCYPDGRCVADSRGVRVMGVLCWPSGSAEACALEAPPDADLVVRVGGR